MTAARTEAERQQSYIRALLEERRSCEAKGKTDRVAQINEQLGEVAKDAEPPAKRSEARPAYEGRRASR